MSAGIKAIAQKLQEKGRGKDTILAHIMPEEAALLKRMGGRGSVNPETGLLEFEAWSASGAADAYGGSWDGGGGSMDTSSGSGFDSSGWGTGGGMLSSDNSSMSSTDGGGWTPSGGGGGGGGGGSLATARMLDRVSVPNYSADVPVSSGESGFGMPTLLSNAASSVGQSLLNFSDYSTGLIKDIYNNPMNYVPGVPSFGTPTITSQSSPLVDTTGNQYHIDSWGNKIVDTPATVPGSTFSTSTPATPVNRVVAGELQLPSAVTFNPSAPTSTTNAYNFTPNYTGLPEEEAGLRSQMLQTSSKQIFDEMAGRTQNAPFPEVVNASDYYGVEPAAGIASLQPRPTTSLLSESAPAGQSLEEIMGTAPVGNPMFPGMEITQTTPTVMIGGKMVPSTFNVNVPSFLVDTRRTQFGTSLYPTEPGLYGAVQSGLPTKGVVFKPGSQMTEIGVPKSGSAVYTGIPFGEGVTEEQIQAAQEYLKTPEALSGYNKFMTDYKSSLTPRSVTGVSLDMSRPGQQAIPDVSGGVGPQGFGDVPLSSDLGTSVIDTLESSFQQMSGAPQGGVLTYPGMPQSTPSMIDYSQAQMAAPVTVGTTPLYAGAQPFSGPKGGTVPMSDEARWAGGGIFSNIEQLNGLPAGYLGRLYGIESTFGKNLTTPLSSAAGPFQFTKATGKQYGLFDGGVDSRMDLLQSAAAAGSLAADNAKVLENALGRPPSSGELYLAHQQGAAGAISLLRNPETSAFNALKRAYGGDEKLAMQALVNNGGTLSMSARQFANMWTSKMNTAPVSPSSGTMYAQLTPAQISKQPELVGNYLDADFQRVVDQIGRADLPAENATDVSQNVFASSGGSGSYSSAGRGSESYIPRRDVVEGEPATGSENVPPPVYTTGMDLTRRAYTPTGLVKTISPAYS